jgi:hypothetical protein
MWTPALSRTPARPQRVASGSTMAVKKRFRSPALDGLVVPVAEIEPVTIKREL